MGLLSSLFNRGPGSGAVTKEDLQKLKAEIIMTIEELGPKLDTIATDLKATVDGQADLAVNLGAVGTQLAKAKEEIVGALSGSHVTLPQAVVEKLDAISAAGVALKANAQTLKESSDGLKGISESLDALNDDLPTPPEPPPAIPGQ